MRRLALFLLLVSCGHRCGSPIPILNYHSISDLDDRYALSERDFAAQLDWLQSHGYSTISLHELFDHREKGTALPAKPIVLTFDDGYLDNYRVALPLLKARGMKATFFVVTRFLGKDEAHRRVEDAATPQPKRFLVWSEVKELAAAGMELGSHSLTHQRLPTLADGEASADLRASRQELQAALGAPVEFFAYPFNSERRSVRKLVEAAGYRGAVAGAHPLGGEFELPRITIYRGMTADALAAALR